VEVAIVDDDPIVQHIASEILTAEGHTTAVFSCGRDFLDAVNNNSTSQFPFNVVLLDSFLGDISGSEVLNSLSGSLENVKRIPRLILTSANSEEDTKTALKGVRMPWSFLPKPFVRDDLLKALKEDQHRERGFTLVELIAVTVLLALMSGILYGSFTSILRAKTSIEEKRVTDRTAQLILDRMMREIGSIPIAGVPLVGHKYLSGEKVQSTRALQQYLIGTDAEKGEQDSDEIRFTSLAGGLPVFNNFSNYGIVEIAYRLESDSTMSGSSNVRTMLIRDEIPAFVTDEEIIRKRRRVLPLANNVVGINLRYYYKHEWHDEWVSRRNTIPEAIEITLSVQSEAADVEHYRTSVAIPNRS
jgi:prepilin-type N-terminal cleavage/methylation domain-containing protein